jgi:hypothetical protein
MDFIKVRGLLSGSLFLCKRLEVKPRVHTGDQQISQGMTEGIKRNSVIPWHYNRITQGFVTVHLESNGAVCTNFYPRIGNAINVCQIRSVAFKHLLDLCNILINIIAPCTSSGRRSAQVFLAAMTLVTELAFTWLTPLTDTIYICFNAQIKAYIKAVDVGRLASVK